MSEILKLGSQRGGTEDSKPVFTRGSEIGKRDNLGRISDAFVQGKRSNLAAHFSGTMQLADLLNNKELLDHLLHSHTFFHAKIGFHNLLMTHICAAASIEKTEYIHTETNFPRSSKTKTLPVNRITVMPIVESEEALNKLVARSFGKAKAVWLIAPPTSIQTHLLVAFSNFFISTATSEDLASFVKVFQFDDSIRDDLSDPEHSKVLFVTDYKPLMQESRSASIAVIRLEGLYE